MSRLASPAAATTRRDVTVVTAHVCLRARQNHLVRSAAKSVFSPPPPPYGTSPGSALTSSLLHSCNSWGVSVLSSLQ